MTLSSVPALTSSPTSLPGHGDPMCTSPDDQNCGGSPPPKKRRVDKNTIENDMKELLHADGEEAEIALILQYEEFASRLHTCNILLNLEASVTESQANELHESSAFYTAARQPWNLDRIDDNEQIFITHQARHEPCLQFVISGRTYSFPLGRVRLICIGPIFNFRHRIRLVWKENLRRVRNARSAPPALPLQILSDILTRPFDVEDSLVFLNDGLTNTQGTCFLATAVQSLSSAFSNLPITISHTSIREELDMFSTLLFQLMELLQFHNSERIVRMADCDRLLHRIVTHPGSTLRENPGLPQCVSTAMEQIGLQVSQSSPYLYDFVEGTVISSNTCHQCRHQQTSTDPITFPITLYFPTFASAVPNRFMDPDEPLDIVDLIKHTYPRRETKPDYKCPPCQASGKTSSTRLINWPAVIVLSLNRITLAESKSEEEFTRVRTINPVRLPSTIQLPHSATDDQEESVAMLASFWIHTVGHNPRRDQDSVSSYSKTTGGHYIAYCLSLIHI